METRTTEKRTTEKRAPAVRGSRRWRSLALLVTVAMLATACSRGDKDKLGRDGANSLERGPKGLVPEVTQAVAPDQALLGELEAAAGRDGSVPVIVGLKVPFRPEGSLEDRARSGQREAIAKAARTLEGALAVAGAKEFFAFETIPYVGLRATPAVLTALKTLPGIASVERDEVRPLPPDESSATTASDDVTATASDPLWNLKRVRAPEAWAAGYDGAGQNVAVIDTGVESTHQELTDKVIAEACFASGNGCPNGASTQTGPGAGAPCPNNPAKCFHGTHVAGTAAGNRTGVAKAAKVVAVQVFAPDGSNAVDLDVLKGLQFVLQLDQKGTQVASVNLSLGGGKFVDPCDAQSRGKAYADMGRNLVSQGVTVVASSGNDGYIDAMGSPACASTFMSVGNTGYDSASQQEFVSKSSNSATFLHVLAPGTDIVSSTLGNKYRSANGTSMASPHVAGAVAVLLHSSPKSTVVETLAALQATGQSLKDAKNSIAKRRIDVAKALERLGGGSGTPSPTPEEPNPTAPPTQPKDPKCSAPGGAKTTLTFANQRASGDVIITWLDQQCEEKPYTIVRAGGTYTQATSVGHRWRVRDDSAKIIREVTATKDPQTVTIGP